MSSSDGHDRRAAAPRGRYAPSPSGELHLGNASTALWSWLSVRARGGRYVMRIEDLDRARSKPEFERRLLDDLAWFGLDWDEGPDVGGECGPYRQSERHGRHRAVFERLRDAGRLFPCFCTRRDLRAAATAPQQPGDEQPYPGTCRSLGPDGAARRIADGEPHAWRFLSAADDPTGLVDLGRGEHRLAAPPGDFVVWRRDGGAAYQLAVVVDDHDMAIDEVVRGDDLLDSAVRQLGLFHALGWGPPAFGHVALLMGRDGARLSKRHAGVTLRELRDAGWSASRLVGWLAARFGARATDEPVAAADLIDTFDWGRLRSAPDGIVFAP